MYKYVYIYTYIYIHTKRAALMAAEVSRRETDADAFEKGEVA